MNRRNFLSKTISFTTLIAFHQLAQKGFAGTNASTLLQPKTRFSNLTLFTAKLGKLLKFYTKKLGLPLLENKTNSFTLRIGESVLTFARAKEGTSPTYHYAFNIPSNKFELGKKWLKSRTPPLKDSNSGDDELYFERWDAHAVYFKDPAGNIGELIARHTLDNISPGDFTLKDLHCVSEISVPVEDPQSLNTLLDHSFRLPKYKNSEMFVGDENGLFVIPPVGRLWIPERILEAESHSIEMTIAEKELSPFKDSSYPYRINGS